MTKQQMIEIRAARRKAGLCITCGEREAGTNKDGTASFRCDPCRAFYTENQRVKKTRHPQAAAPVVRRCVEVETYFETSDYKRYELIILGILETADGAMGTAEIKATWPDGNHRWLIDTLHRLEAVGLVESFQWGARRGYRKSEPRRSTLATDTVKQNEYKAHLRFLGQCYPTEAMIRGVV